MRSDLPGGKAALTARLLGPDDYKVMPWKNGLGTTTEIAIHPPGAGLAAAPFDWRVSLADVGADGDFSRFPGYERSILVAGGAGMELGFDSAPPARLTGLGAMTSFSGDWYTRCRLLDGPVRDFNVMSARARVEHLCIPILGNHVEFVWDPRRETLLCYSIQGNLVLKMRDSAEWGLEAGHALLLPAVEGAPMGASLIVMPHTRETLGVVVRLTQL